jgi:hypothetical protein
MAVRFVVYGSVCGNVQLSGSAAVRGCPTRILVVQRVDHPFGSSSSICSETTYFLNYHEFI